MHTTMQTLGRVAIIGGGVFVSLLNVLLFQDVEAMPEAQKVATYIRIYELCAGDPDGFGARRRAGRTDHAPSPAAAARQRHGRATRPPNWPSAAIEKTQPNWWILGGGLAFVVFTISMGLSDISFNKEIIFVGSMAIVLFLMSRLIKVLEPDDRLVLVGTAVIIFVYRAMPTPGAGQTWWMIDELGFDQQFLAVLSLISSVLTLFGMFLFRRFMAERSIAYVVVFLTIASTLLYLPIVGMFYGLHQWTAATDGRRRRRALHRPGGHRTGIAAGSDRDDPDACLDRQFGPQSPQGDLLRGDGLVHQSGAVGEPARHQVP